MFFVFGFVFMALGAAFIGWRLVRPTGWGDRHRRLVRWGLAGTLLVAAGAPFASTALRTGQATTPEGIAVAGYVAVGFLSLLLAFVLGRDLLLLAHSAAHRIRKQKPDEGRRRFIAGAMNVGLVGASGVLTGAGYGEARRVPDIREVDVPLRDLDPRLEGFRIAQITDVHVGPTIKGDWVREVVDAVNGLDADAVAVTGDMVDGTVAALKDDVAPLADMRARHGVFFVTGNHEYYSGADAWVAHVRRLGMQPLLNEHRVLDHDGAPLVMAGVTDYRAHRFGADHRSDPEKALRDAPERAPKIVLAHQPRSADAVRDAGADLQLSGHTHGGQYFPWTVVIHFVERFVAGLYDHGPMKIYVSRGTGYWGPPTRVGSPPEITLLTLRRAA